MQIALGAALAFSAAPRIVSDLISNCIGKPQQAARDAMRRATSIATACVVGVSCALMVSRSVAQVRYYGAPAQAWQVIAGLDAASLTQTAAGDVTDAPVRACVGAEWHRFSSSFFLPAGVELAFVEFGKTGTPVHLFARAPDRGMAYAAQSQMQAGPILRVDMRLGGPERL